MIVNTIQTASQFRDQFIKMGRDNFSYDGYIALFDYLDILSDDIGEHIEMDVIAICCEYTEYDSLQDLAETYFLSFTKEQLKDVKEHKEGILDYFRSNTQLIEVDGGTYIIAEF